MRIGVIGAGHAFSYQYQALKDLGFELYLCDSSLDKLSMYNELSTTDYHELLGRVDLVLVSTPPEHHFDIIKFFLENRVFVISEKPLVTNLDDLNYLDKIIDNNFYNILHFSFGDEIEWFLNSKYINLVPNKIEAYINDPYILNNHICEDRVKLHGSYLDEAINPLSAVARIYGYDISYVNSTIQKLDGDLYDYKSTSKFLIGDIPVTINTSWNDYNDKSKYIDLYFDDFTIRLDSINSCVINLTTNETLFKSTDERMYKHYLNGLSNIYCNKDISVKLHQELLRYVL